MWFKGKSKKENNYDILLAVYNHTQSEITRYRDREWAIPGIFIAAMIATISFIILNSNEIKHFRFVIDIFLYILALGNSFYSLLTHDKLTKQRIIRNDISYKLGIQNYCVGNKKIFKSYEIHLPDKEYSRKEWFRGFWDHVFPFILSGWILFFIGRWILFKSPFLLIFRILHRLMFLF